MNILIVEDELLIAEMLKEMLHDLGHKVDGIAKNYEQAETSLYHNKEINFCFLDINLQSTKSGFDVAKLIMNHFFIPFVFLTSYSDKSMIAQALEFKPDAYLIKPFSEIDLFTTIEIIKNKQQLKMDNHSVDSIIIKEGTSNIKIQVEDILWVQSNNIYVEIKTRLKTHLVRNSLIRFLEEVNIAPLKRIHRTFAVNLNHVNAVNGQYLLIGNEKLPLSRKYRDEILETFR